MNSLFFGPSNVLRILRFVGRVFDKIITGLVPLGEFFQFSKKDMVAINSFLKGIGQAQLGNLYTRWNEIFVSTAF